MCAFGCASRSALSAGKVRMKSPIAPPRITRIRFMCGNIDFQSVYPAVCKLLDQLSGQYLCWRTRRRTTFLILRKREGENHAAVNERNSMQTAPAKNCSRAPVDLIAKHVRDCDPKQSGNNQQISECRYK